MQEIARTLDSKVFNLGGRKRGAIIQNGMHYRDKSSGLLLDVDTTVEAANDYEFSHKVSKARVTTRFGDTSTNSKKHLFGLEDNDGNWLNIKLDRSGYGMGGISGNRPRFPNEAEKVLIECRPTYKGVKVDYILQDATAPSDLVFTLKHSPQLTPEQREGGIVITKDGADIFLMPPPFVMDANGNHGTVTMTLEQGAPFDTITLSVDPAWLATAAYPVTIDPSATVSGAGSFEESCMFQGDPNHNMGTSTVWYCNKGGSLDYSIIFKADLTAYTGITVLTARWNLYCYSKRNGWLYTDFYPVMKNWNVGTTSWGIQTGSVCWNAARYAQSNWQTGGCRGAADRGSLAGTISFNGTGWKYPEFNASIAQGWIDAPSTNHGMMMEARTGGDYSFWVPTESGWANPAFYMTYEVAAGGVPPLVNGGLINTGLIGGKLI